MFKNDYELKKGSKICYYIQKFPNFVSQDFFPESLPLSSNYALSHLILSIFHSTVEKSLVLQNSLLRDVCVNVLKLANTTFTSHSRLSLLLSGRQSLNCSINNRHISRSTMIVSLGKYLKSLSSVNKVTLSHIHASEVFLSPYRASADLPFLAAFGLLV